jgi:hypothetical protein
VAFALAFISLRLLLTILLPALGAHRTSHLTDGGLFGPVQNFRLRFITWNISFVTAQCLWFVLSYVAIRFGLRNRLAQLAGVLLLLALPVYTLRPWLMDLSGILTASVMAAALLLPAWRKSMLVLAATCITTVATVAGCFYVVFWAHHASLATLTTFDRKAYEMVGLIVAVFVLSHMHRLLLRPRPTISLT